MHNISSSAAGNAAQQPILSHKQTIQCDVVFGQSSNRCVGAGICHVMRLDTPPAGSACRTCRRAKAVLSRMDEKTVRFQFLRTDISMALMKDFFRHAEFILPESGELPLDIARDLDLSAQTLRAGAYAIVADDVSFSIDIPVG